MTEAGIYFGYYVIRNLIRSSFGRMDLEEKTEKLIQSAQSNLNFNTPYDGALPYPPKREGIFLLIFLAFIVGMVLFIIYFLLLTKKFVYYLDAIGEGIKELSIGNFNARVYIKNEDEFALIAEYLNKMAEDIRILMENERKNEKAKNDLITSVAHDLRTPLTSIIGYLDLVSKKKDLDEGVRDKYISIAYDKSKRLEKLIEDLFSYTKYSSGEVNLNYQSIDMVKLLEQMVDEFYPSFQEANLEYEFTVSHNQAVIEADGDLLSRAITNLISNAVKYGRDGKVIKISLIKMEKMVSVSITNYGEVIPEKDIESIFDRFFRVENSRSRETGGTGLGLAITKRIILMHQGSIRVKSDVDGTAFEVMLPIKAEGKRQDMEGN